MATTFKILGWSFIVVSVALYFASVNYTQLIDYPLCGGTTTVVIAAIPSQTPVALRPDCWSGWISMPNTPYRSRVTIDPPGPLEMKLLGGERFLFGTDPESIGGIGNADFQLRGGGVATIAVEPQ